MASVFTSTSHAERMCMTIAELIAISRAEIVFGTKGLSPRRYAIAHNTIMMRAATLTQIQSCDPALHYAAFAEFRQDYGALLERAREANKLRIAAECAERAAAELLMDLRCQHMLESLTIVGL